MGLGDAHYYSLIDEYAVARQERLLPIGLAKGATVTHAVRRNDPIALDDVELKEPSTVLSLRRLQDAWMVGEMIEDTLLQAVDQLAAD
jgi:predicted homoserine dehydrogenase-like protein